MFVVRSILGTKFSKTRNLDFYFCKSEKFQIQKFGTKIRWAIRFKIKITVFDVVEYKTDPDHFDFIFFDFKFSGNVLTPTNKYVHTIKIRNFL